MPRPAVVARYRARDITLFNTAVAGAVTLDAAFGSPLFAISTPPEAVTIQLRPFFSRLALLAVAFAGLVALLGLAIPREAFRR